jgi:hypothetical protein
VVVGIVLAGIVPGALFALDWDERSVVHSQQLGTSINPVGLSLFSRLSLSVPLYREAEGVLWDSAKVEAGVINRLTPAFDDVGAEFYFEPIAIADVRARFVVRQMFDGLGNGYAPLDGPDVNYGPAADLDRYTRMGTMVEINPRFKIAVGPIIAFDQVTLRRVEMTEKSDESGWFYEPLGDVAQENGDWQFGNSAVVLWDTPLAREGSPRQVLLGVDYSLMSVDMDDPEWQRVSLMAVWSAPDLFGEDGPAFSLVGLLGAPIEHRYYDLADGEPYVAMQAGLTWNY